MDTSTSNASLAFKRFYTFAAISSRGLIELHVNTCKPQVCVRHTLPIQSFSLRVEFLLLLDGILS
jgi:hypothetical protein